MYSLIDIIILIVISGICFMLFVSLTIFFIIKIIKRSGIKPIVINKYGEPNKTTHPSNLKPSVENDKIDEALEEQFKYLDDMDASKIKVETSFKGKRIGGLDEKD